MMEQLLQVDKAIFHWINHGWSNGFFDILMPALRNKYFWVPLYAFCLGWIIFNQPLKHIVYSLLFISFSIFASDTISSKLIKYEVQRPRPCHESAMEPPVNLLVSCGSGYSFPSSHAANHFCLAAFLVILYGSYMQRWRHLWWVWAALISIAQVYVGLHYPLDIFGGALLGVIVGTSMGIFCKHRIKPVQHATS